MDRGRADVCSESCSPAAKANKQELDVASFESVWAKDAAGGMGASVARSAKKLYGVVMFSPGVGYRIENYLRRVTCSSCAFRVPRSLVEPGRLSVKPTPIARGLPEWHFRRGGLCFVLAVRVRCRCWRHTKWAGPRDTYTLRIPGFDHDVD